MCVLACTVCVWGKDWWRCWAIWMTGHANFQANAYRKNVYRLFSYNSVPASDIQQRGIFLLPRSGLIRLPEHLDNNIKEERE